MTLLRDIFGDRINSKDRWPVLSPDLTAPDYCLWGAMEGVVYKDNPLTLLELTEANSVVMNSHPIEVFRVFANKKRHVDACLQARWGNFQHLL
jgi:hypothetical protein